MSRLVTKCKRTVMSGDVVVLLTALGVLFIALVAACAVAYGFWRGGL
jgi:hypothetical protein